MTDADPLLRIPLLYHFTDRRNLRSIRELGGLLPASQLAARGVQVLAPGGNEWSRNADAMKGTDKYVHLCPRNTHPMEYLARKHGQIGRSIFLEIDRAVLDLPGVMFTPDVSNKAGVAICTLEEAKDKIDYDVLYTRKEWKDPAIRQRLVQATKCELLVPQLIPLNLIRNMPND
jgi:hypothetical protein